MPAPLKSDVRVGLTPAQQFVLNELTEISQYGMVKIVDGYVRPFHIRYFRGKDTTPTAIQAMSLRAIESTLRRLFAKGLVEKRAGRAEFRLPTLDAATGEGRR